MASVSQRPARSMLAGLASSSTYRSDERAARALVAELGEDRCAFAQCDLTESETLPKVVELCLARFGCIDVLVNNAGVFETNPFFGTSYADWVRGWNATFAVNVFGTANLTYLVLQHMRDRKQGKILNVASRAAHRGELTFADYGASKAAIVNLTKSIARACAGEGITSVAIAPGFIETQMASEELARRRRDIEAEIPMQRVGTPEDVAEAIVFLAFGGTYLNDATIDINGGSYVR